MTSFYVFIASSNLGHGTVSLVRICWLFGYCCRYHWVLFCFVVFLVLHLFFFFFFFFFSFFSSSFFFFFFFFGGGGGGGLSSQLHNQAVGKKSSLTEVGRAQIVTLHGEGYTERDIAAKLSCSKTAVHRAIVKFSADGTFHHWKMSGHPRKTTPRETAQ